MKERRMEQSNGVDTPLTPELTQLTNNRPQMNKYEASEYRRAVARINYMSQDRCDLSSASRTMPQSMSDPRVGDEALVKRAIIYLRTYPRYVNYMGDQGDNGLVKVMVDSDWAGDINSRRSTSGGIIYLGQHLITHWS